MASAWNTLLGVLHLVMEVLEGQAAWLSDFEVLQHLRERRERREEAGRSMPATENVQTIEFEASVAIYMCPVERPPSYTRSLAY